MPFVTFSNFSPNVLELIPSVCVEGIRRSERRDNERAGNRQKIKGASGATGAGSWETEQVMSEKMNWVIDSVPIRVTLNVLAWAVWIACAVGVLEFASKF